MKKTPMEQAEEWHQWNLKAEAAIMGGVKLVEFVRRAGKRDKAIARRAYVAARSDIRDAAVPSFDLSDSLKVRAHLCGMASTHAGVYNLELLYKRLTGCQPPRS